MYTIIIFGLTLWLIRKSLLSHSMLILKYLGSFRLRFCLFFRGRHFLLKIASTYSKHYSLLPEQRVLLRLSEKETLYLKISLKQEILLSLLLAVPGYEKIRTEGHHSTSE